MTFFRLCFCLNRQHEFEYVKKTVWKELEICGFIDIKDVANPPHVSRHLVLPLPAPSSPVKSETHGTGNWYIHVSILGAVADKNNR